MEKKNLLIISLYIKKLFNWKNLLLFFLVGILCYIFLILLTKFCTIISSDLYDSLIIGTYISFIYLNFITFYSVIYLKKIKINNDKYFFSIFIFIFIFYLLIIIISSMFLYSFLQNNELLSNTDTNNFKYLYPKIVALNILALFTILLINNKNYIFYYFILLIQIWLIFNYFVHIISITSEKTNVDFMLGLILSVDVFLILFNWFYYLFWKKYINLLNLQDTRNFYPF